MARFPLPAKPDRDKVEAGEVENGFGDFVCEECQYTFKEHAPVPGYWHLRRLCDGSFVRLIG